MSDKEEKKVKDSFGETEGKERVFRFILIVGFIISLWVIRLLIEQYL